MNWCLGSTPNRRLIGMLWFIRRQLEIDWLKEKMGFQSLNFLEVFIVFVLYQIFHRQIRLCFMKMWACALRIFVLPWFLLLLLFQIWNTLKIWNILYVCVCFFFLTMSTVKCLWKYITSSSCNNIGPYLKLYFHTR